MHYHYWFCIFRNLDIRDAILQLLNVIRDGNKKLAKHDESDLKMGEKVKLHEIELSFFQNIWLFLFLQILKSLNAQSGTGSFEKKIDNISTFLLR